MKIFLVRHAQSQANVDYRVLKLKTNMSITLSDKGVVQANETGDFLTKYFLTNGGAGDIKVWNSPYQRTRQTSKIIKDCFEKMDIDFEEDESIYLSERQFGLVDDVSDYKSQYIHESKHYNLHKKHNHDFFARPPLGESAFDMCLRLDFFLKSILEKESVKNHIIVSHGAAIRGLIMMNQGDKYETYNSPNPYNASVRLIDSSNYIGEIFSPSDKTV